MSEAERELATINLVAARAARDKAVDAPKSLTPAPFDAVLLLSLNSIADAASKPKAVVVGDLASDPDIAAV